MAYRDLRDFLSQLEAHGELKRVAVPVDPKLEMTEMCDRVLKAGGPALLFEQPKGDFRAPNGSARAGSNSNVGTAAPRLSSSPEAGTEAAWFRRPSS